MNEKGHAVRVTHKMRDNMRAWMRGTGFSWAAHLKGEFHAGGRWEALGLRAESPFSVFICPMCDYATSVTNVCRECPEMPADQELVEPFNAPRPCHYKGHQPHIGSDGKRRGHGYTMMVRVA